VLTGSTISNGLGWSPDATRMYYVDSAPRTLDVLDSLAIPADRIEVVISKHGAKAAVPIEEAKRNLGLSTTHLLPRDDDTALQAVNKGVPLSEVRASSPLRKAIAELAETLGQLGGAPVPKKKRKGILGGLFAS